MTELQDPWLRDLLLWWIAVPFLVVLFGSIGAVFAAVVPERAAAVHRTGPYGWWSRWTARNERIVRERETRREHS